MLRGSLSGLVQLLQALDRSNLFSKSHIFMECQGTRHYTIAKHSLRCHNQQWRSQECPQEYQDDCSQRCTTAWYHIVSEHELGCPTEAACLYPRCSCSCGHLAPQGIPNPHLSWIHPLHIPNRHKVFTNFVFQSVFPCKTQNHSFMCSRRQPRQARKLPYFDPTFCTLTFCSSREPGHTPLEP